MPWALPYPFHLQHISDCPLTINTGLPMVFMPTVNQAESEESLMETLTPAAHPHTMPVHRLRFPRLRLRYHLRPLLQDSAVLSPAVDRSPAGGGFPFTTKSDISTTHPRVIRSLTTTATVHEASPAPHRIVSDWHRPLQSQERARGQDEDQPRIRTRLTIRLRAEDEANRGNVGRPLALPNDTKTAFDMYDLLLACTLPSTVWIQECTVFYLPNLYNVAGPRVNAP
jgi:hypothetical protein